VKLAADPGELRSLLNQVGLAIVDEHVESVRSAGLDQATHVDPTRFIRWRIESRWRSRGVLQGTIDGWTFEKFTWQGVQPVCEGPSREASAQAVVEFVARQLS
jgi:hypothetical protein